MRRHRLLPPAYSKLAHPSLSQQREFLLSQVAYEQGRTSKLEISVGRALDDVLPKVEELLARHLSPQPFREAALGHVAPAVASAAPNSTAPTNADSPVGMPQQNLQHGLLAGGGRALPPANASASTKPTECALVTDGGGATVPPAPSSEGAAPASRPWAPPPPAASGATNPPASLHEAAERGDAVAVQRFLADRAPVDARDKDGNTALHIAASSGRTEVVDILIAKGAVVNRLGFGLRTPLHCAAAKGHETIVTRLVTAGAKLDSRDADGATSAALAAQGGHPEVVLWLLDRGTPVEAADKEGRTRLMYAVEGGNLPLVTYLLEKGANLIAVNKKGETSIFMAVKVHDGQIVKFLLERDASPFQADKSNESTLLFGSKKGYGDVIGERLKVAATGITNLLGRCLCAAGSADVVWSFTDEAHNLVLGPAGGEALVEAARDGRLEVVEALLRVGAGAKESREEALLAAAKKGHTYCVVALLDTRVDVNARDIKTKLTALYLAAMNGHAECMEVFWITLQFLRDAAIYVTAPILTPLLNKEQASGRLVEYMTLFSNKIKRKRKIFFSFGRKKQQFLFSLNIY
ncbi:Ankyrin repeat domain-containing protein 50 [Gryllus bimaculatus]|nr:Ankyrin repeat domain-containing protein 50 [Gryllus bimaculatus]